MAHCRRFAMSTALRHRARQGNCLRQRKRALLLRLPSLTCCRRGQANPRNPSEGGEMHRAERPLAHQTFMKNISSRNGIPTRQIEKGKSFFSSIGLDVRHFSSLWHIYKVAHLMEIDLNNISLRNGLSIADFHLLGAVMMSDPEPMTATDLANALNVSNAALSVRIGKLSRAGLLTCTASKADRRTKILQQTPAGAAKVRVIGVDLENAGRFAHHYQQLSDDDRAALDRIVGHLHSMLDRDFLPAKRGGG